MVSLLIGSSIDPVRRFEAYIDRFANAVKIHDQIGTEAVFRRVVVYVTEWSVKGCGNVSAIVACGDLLVHIDYDYDARTKCEGLRPEALPEVRAVLSLAERISLRIEGVREELQQVRVGVPPSGKR
jgi:hypothetical protein